MTSNKMAVSFVLHNRQGLIPLRNHPNVHGMQEVSGSIPLRSTSLFAFLDENPVQAICSALTGFSAF